MQQTEAAADLQELVDKLRLQKAELDRMCNELIEQQLTQDGFDTVAAVCTEKLQMAENQTKNQIASWVKPSKVHLPDVNNQAE